MGSGSWWKEGEDGLQARVMSSHPSLLSPSPFLSRFRLEKGTESTALSNCLIVNDLDFGGAQYVRVNRQYFLAVK